MFFSTITKNLNLEFLTKNLVTFKRPDGVNDDKCWYLYLESSMKKMIFSAGDSQETKMLGDCLKRGLAQFLDLRDGT